MNKKYFGYIRVSTARQGEQGVSLQEQRAAIADYAQRFALDVVEWFEERETAAHAGRQVFSRMLKLLRSRKADGLILHKIDRGARNLRDWTDLIALSDEGVEVRFTNDNLDLHSRGGRLAADIQAVVAADYIRNLREETRKGFYGRIKQGLLPLPAPIGYVDRGPGRAKEPDPAKAPLVRQAFELYASGLYTLDGLLATLTAKGLRNRRGHVLSRTGVSNVLNNPFYLGLIRLKRSGETFPGAHRPLVSKVLFDQVQAILDGRTPRRVHRHRHLFARLFHCGTCGFALIAEIQKGHVYYRCHTSTCKGVCVREEAIDSAIACRLAEVQFSQDEFAAAREALGRIIETWNGDATAEVTSCKLELGALQDRLNRLADAFVDELIDKELFENRKASCLLRQRELRDRLAELSTGNGRMPERLTKFLELAGSALIQYKVGIDAEKRENWAI